MGNSSTPRVTICIPHWQVKSLISICLRSIRQHSRSYDVEVIIVDNGSKDESLDYLRNLSWIRLIERPEERRANFPRNVFTAWDRGIQEATGDYFMTMHSDVFVKTDDWLDPFLREMSTSDKVAGAGAWKLNLENPLYTFQKRVFGYVLASTKKALGMKKRAEWRQGCYPRDYCAMYRPDAIRENDMVFQLPGDRAGGLSIAQQLWKAGFQTRMIPIRELYPKIVHIAHGTAAIVAENPLSLQGAQYKAARKVRQLFAEAWVQNLRHDESLDN